MRPPPTSIVGTGIKIAGGWATPNRDTGRVGFTCGYQSRKVRSPKGVGLRSRLKSLLAYTSRSKDRLFGRQPTGWYLIDFARSRHTNPARVPVSVNADWYNTEKARGPPRILAKFELRKLHRA